MKQTAIRFVTFIAGLYFLLEFILPKKVGGFEFGLYHEQILDGARTVGAMAIGLGVINILFVHGLRLVKRSKGILESAAVIFGFLIMTAFQGAEFVSSERAVTAWQQYAAVKEYFEKNRTAVVEQGDNQTLDVAAKFYNEQRSSLSPTPERMFNDLDAAIVKELTVISEIRSADSVDTATRDLGFESLLIQTAAVAKIAQDYYPAAAKEGLMPKLSDFLFYGFFVPLGASMFALLGFYIVTAAYNSFRARSVEAAVMMFAAIIVILGQIPQGSLYISDQLPFIRLWLLENLNTPANRAIYFGSAIAGLAMAVRLWLSLDKSQQMGGER